MFLKLRDIKNNFVFVCIIQETQKYFVYLGNFYSFQVKKKEKERKMNTKYISLKVFLVNYKNKNTKKEKGKKILKIDRVLMV